MPRFSRDAPLRHRRVLLRFIEATLFTQNMHTLRAMVAYRRNFAPGGTYFFTATLADRRSMLLTDRIDDLRDAFRYTQSRWPFQMIAAVVLPDHMHCVWELPAGDADYSQRWRSIKSRFSRACAASRVGNETNGLGERGIWQRRFWEHTIRDDRDLQNHVDYVHFNPVKHGHTKRASDWPHSTIHSFIKRGIIAHDWACDPLKLPTIENDT